MCFIAAGGSSASISSDKSLYIWGREFETPTKVQKIAEAVESVSIGLAFGVALTSDQKLYTWGQNAHGQLGKGDFQSSNSAKPLKKLTSDGKAISKLACGSNFALCLSQLEAVADQMQQQNMYDTKVSNLEAAKTKEKNKSLKKLK